MLANHIVVLNGKVIGGWRRLQERNGVVVKARLLVRLAAAQRRALQAAVERFGGFVGVPARLDE